MELTAYLRILKQRWRLLLVPVVAALAIAAITLPQQDATPVTPVATTYNATATLITSPTITATPNAAGLSTVALYATVGEIPDRAAKILGYQGEPQLLATMVQVAAQPETGTLTITSSDPIGKEAAARVNAFSRATIEFFRDQATSQGAAQEKALQREIESTKRELTAAQAKLNNGDNAVNRAEVAALENLLTDQIQTKNTAASTTSGPSFLTVLQPGVPIPADGGEVASTSLGAPASPYLRIGLAALLGLLLGGALALVVERLDSRMRTREQAEDAIGLPVLAEIPLMPKRQREGVASAERPASTVAEAFRGLRSSVLLLSPSLSRAATTGAATRGSIVVMVTSALPGAGKTTTVANLAAVMAEAGRRVLVLSLDLRNPTIHTQLGVANGTGISELLSADRGHHLEQVVHETSIPGVSLASSGHDTDHPGALLASVGPLIEAARALADVVIVDAPPMLTVSDALDVARHTDVTLLVSRLNKTTQSQALECQRLFKRLGVSALGTVLVGSKPAGARYGYPVVAPADGAAHHTLDDSVLARDER